MFKKIFPAIFCLAILLVAPKVTYAFSGTGTGTSDDPYIITTCLQLQEMSNDTGGVYQLANDIECGAGAPGGNDTNTWNSGEGFAPVGNVYAAFAGELRGNGYKIKGLFINLPSDDNIGLFGSLDGTVSQLGLVDVNITGASRVAAFAGVASQSIESSYSTGVITGGAEVSGLVGENSATIEKSYSSATITASTNFDGGLVGYNYGIIRNSYATGSVSSTGSYVGGVVGENDGGEITDTYATGDVSADDIVGGLIGDNNDAGSVVNSFAVGKVTATNISPTAVGGLAGEIENAGTFTNSFYYYNAGSTGHDLNNGIGTQETNIATFYSKNHSVYDQGGANKWDFASIWVEHGDTFPTFVWQLPPPGLTAPSSNSSSSPVHGCSASAPVAAPNLFQIDVNSTQALLHFAPVTGNVSNYYVSYGYQAGDERFGTFTNSGTPNGALTFTVNYLQPNQTYFFKVRAFNDCVPGNWSNEVKVTTAKKGTTQGMSYFKDFPAKPSIFPKSVLGLTSTNENPTIGCEYAVQPGDSLWSIASSGLGSGAKYQQLMQQNNLNSTFLQIGQKLKVNC